MVCHHGGRFRVFVFRVLVFRVLGFRVLGFRDVRVQDLGRKLWELCWWQHAIDDWHAVGPISVLRFWISEGLTRAASRSQGLGFSCPWGISLKSLAGTILLVGRLGPSRARAPALSSGTGAAASATFMGSHLSNTTCLTQRFSKSDKDDTCSSYGDPWHRKQRNQLMRPY